MSTCDRCEQEPCIAANGVRHVSGFSVSALEHVFQPHQSEPCFARMEIVRGCWIQDVHMSANVSLGRDGVSP
jgi:hypothetical protein